jgi:hypothetical protein
MTKKKHRKHGATQKQGSQYTHPLEKKQEQSGTHVDAKQTLAGVTAGGTLKAVNETFSGIAIQEGQGLKARNLILESKGRQTQQKIEDSHADEDLMVQSTASSQALRPPIKAYDAVDGPFLQDKVPPVIPPLSLTPLFSNFFPQPISRVTPRKQKDDEIKKESTDVPSIMQGDYPCVSEGPYQQETEDSVLSGEVAISSNSVGHDMNTHTYIIKGLQQYIINNYFLAGSLQPPLEVPSILDDFYKVEKKDLVTEWGEETRDRRVEITLNTISQLLYSFTTLTAYCERSVLKLYDTIPKTVFGVQLPEMYPIEMHPISHALKSALFPRLSFFRSAYGSRSASEEIIQSSPSVFLKC